MPSNGPSHYLFGLALGASVVLHLAAFLMLPALGQDAVEFLEPEETMEVLLIDEEPKPPEPERPLPSAEGFVSIAEEALPGEGLNIPAGFSLFDAPPELSLPKLDAPPDPASIPLTEPQLPKPLVDGPPPEHFQLNPLPKGLMEGNALPSKLTGASSKPSAGSLADLPQKPHATPKDFPSNLSNLKFADLEGPVATRVTYQPPPPVLEKSENLTIQLKFWVRPDGQVGNVVPVQKGSVELERIAIDYLQRWKFSALPTDVEQIKQWGLITITFRTKS